VDHPPLTPQVAVETSIVYKNKAPAAEEVGEREEEVTMDSRGAEIAREVPWRDILAPNCAPEEVPSDSLERDARVVVKLRVAPRMRESAVMEAAGVAV